eukprot:GILJ01005469.1.p1 GENE.GILJ01005469.1~~GILJ01005469.1.p1  ORF type:complete len:427 (+),score=53.60 GILJ01005469.1:68-1348(+)
MALLQTLVCAVFVAIALVVSAKNIWTHLTQFHRPQWQTKIVRILFMVPIYSVTSFLGFLNPEGELYYNLIRDSYEAYLLWTFVILIIQFLRESRHSMFTFYHSDESVPTQKHMFPVCFWRPIIVDQRFLSIACFGTLQYAVLEVVTSVLAVVFNSFGIYGDGVFVATNAYFYIIIVQYISVMVALYWLVMVYLAFRQHLANYKPTAKFFCIKGVIFFTWWQNIFISAASSLGLLDWIGSDLDLIGAKLQNFLICIEMCGFAIGNRYAFSISEVLYGPAAMAQETVKEKEKELQREIETKEEGEEEEAELSTDDSSGSANENYSSSRNYIYNSNINNINNNNNRKQFTAGIKKVEFNRTYLEKETNPILALTRVLKLDAIVERRRIPYADLSQVAHVQLCELTIQDQHSPRPSLGRSSGISFSHDGI